MDWTGRNKTLFTGSIALVLHRIPTTAERRQAGDPVKSISLFGIIGVQPVPYLADGVRVQALLVDNYTISASKRLGFIDYCGERVSIE